jgi:Holliday junction resolvase-like predicted endonuclease
MTDEELKALVASLAVAQERTSEKMDRTDEQIKRTDEKLERIGIYLGNITKNQGDVAEDFFYQSLVKDNHLGSIRFDDITKNMQKHRGDIQEEYDLLMTNGDAIAVVEVKYKAHENDIDKLERKMDNFKKLFPIYKDYKLYGALASFHINDNAKKEALRRGYFVLQRSGDLIHSECGEQLKVL